MHLCKQGTVLVPAYCGKTGSLIRTKGTDNEAYLIPPDGANKTWAQSKTLCIDHNSAVFDLSSESLRNLRKMASDPQNGEPRTVDLPYT